MRASILRVDRRYQGVFENNSASSGVYLNRASNSLFNVGSPSKFTVRVRCRPTLGSATNNNCGLMTRSSLSSAQGDWALGFFNGSTIRPTFRVNNNGASVQSATTLTVGAWYLIEASYDSSLGSNNLKLFINGTLDVQGTYTTAVTDNAVQLVVGSYFDTTHNFVGQISEVDFSAAVVRNTASYTPPTSLTPDSNTTVLWTFPTVSTLGLDIGKNALNASQQGTYAFADLLYRKVI